MSAKKIHELRKQVMELRGQIAALQKVLPRETVEDYKFDSEAGPVSLASLFGDRDSLFVVHNMGTGCNYCMLWADGFNGVADHLKDRAAFVISSPDSVETQQAVRADRNWDFQMVSVEKNSFAKDMGFTTDDGFLPGVSVFQRDGDNIVRVASSMFGPGDDFCAVWHLFDLLPEGANGWQPKPHYG
jgi:predicted dithiol-disulfide oxidoreductase (DUF899 family)